MPGIRPLLCLNCCRGYFPTRKNRPTMKNTTLFVLCFTLLTFACQTEETDKEQAIFAKGYDRHVELQWPHHPEASTYQILLSMEDRKSTRLNSSHVRISYAVFCLKKKNQHNRERI